MSGPLARVVAQIFVAGVGVVSRAFVQAYAQAVHNAKNGATTASAAAATLKPKMTQSQALEILNITQKDLNAGPQVMKKQYDKYFAANDVKNGGSFYLQSKVYRAKELLDQHFKEREEEARNRSKGGS